MNEDMQIFRLCSTHLSSSIHLVGEFDLVEGHGRFHPVSAEVWRVRVDVDATVAPAFAAAFRPAGRHPLPVYKLPAAAVSRDEVQQEGVHGAGVQARDAHFQHWEHATEERHTAWLKGKVYVHSQNPK